MPPPPAADEPERRLTPGARIRPAGPGDAAGLAELFARAYGKPLSVERWRWKLGRLTGPAPNAWLAEGDGAPVCQYAAMPLAIQLGGRISTAMVAVDAMTSPEHRRRGLLTQVAGEAHEAWRRAGIPLVLGLPNERWGSRIQALGWMPLFRLRRLTFPLRPGAILRRRFGGLVASVLGPLATAWLRPRFPRPHDPRTAAQPVARAGPAMDALWERLGSTLSHSVRRDASFVEWRFLEAPDPAYRVLLLQGEAAPVAWSAFRVEGSTGDAAGLIADVVANPSRAEAWDEVIAATLDALSREGAVTASTLAVEGTLRYRRLVERGFRPRPQGFPVHAVLLDVSLDQRALRRAEAWDMSGGDFDVI